MFDKVFKFNPNHDNLGKFSAGDGGGEGGGGGHSKDPSAGVNLYNTKDDPHVTKETILAGFDPKVREEIAAMDANANAATSTESLYKDAQGNWTADRNQLHESVINTIVSDAAIKAATPAPGTKPDLILLGGRGGSGKSAFTNGVIKEFNGANYIHLDADEVKKLLPEYNGKNAAAVHEESKYLYNQIAAVALKNHLNLLVDGTMNSAKNLQGLMDKSKKEGYTTQVHYMFLPRQEAANRAVKRALGPTGRYVPIDVVLENTTNEKTFATLAHQSDRWSIYRNDVPKGQKPKKVASHD